MVMTMRTKMRKSYYQLRNSTNTIAVIMVLFLSFIAAILYLNEKELSEKEQINTVPQQQSISPTGSTKNDAPGLFLPASPSPLPSSIFITVESSISYSPTPAPTTLDIPPMQDSSSGSETVESVTPVQTKPSPLPDAVPAIKLVTPSASPAAASPPEKTAMKKVLVVIDPGHGGIDPGTCSIYQEKLYEKDINLDIARKLKTLLENSQIPVLLTRESDVEVLQSNQYDNDANIRERPAIANRNNATLFISIHVNAYDTKLPGGELQHGTEIYHAGKTHGAFTSKQFAEMMGKAIDKKTETRYNGVLKKNFGVLRLSGMPALLIETAYLTNREDHKLLESDEFRSAMAEGMHDGIMDILETMGAYKKNGTWRISVNDDWLHHPKLCSVRSIISS